MSVCVTPSWISRARKRRSSGSPQIVDERRRIDLAWVPIAMAIKPLPPRRINPSPAVVRGSPTSVLLPPVGPSWVHGIEVWLGVWLQDGTPANQGSAEVAQTLRQSGPATQQAGFNRT